MRPSLQAFPQIFFLLREEKTKTNKKSQKTLGLIIKTKTANYLVMSKRGTTTKQDLCDIIKKYLEEECIY